MNLGDLASVAIIFVVTIVAIAIGMDLVESVHSDNACASTFGYNSTTGHCCQLVSGVQNCSTTQALTLQGNATLEGKDAISNFSERLPILATAVVLAIVIGVLLKAFRII